MNKRTGWNRRWLQSRNPTLESLEARLVLAEAARLGLQPLLAHAEQLGKAANAGVTIDSVIPTGNPKDGSPFLDRKDPGGKGGPPPASPQFLSQDSLSEGRAAFAPPSISVSIEASVVGLAPSSATEAAAAIRAFASLAAAVAGETLANSIHDPPASSLKHAAAPSETPATARGGEPNAPSQTADTPDSDAGQPAEPTPRPERAAPERPDANAGLALAAASAEPAPGAPPPAPFQSVEALSGQGTPPVTGQGVSYRVSSSRFIDGFALQQRIHESQELPAADFTALPVDETTEVGMPSPTDRLALRSEDDGEAHSAPLSGDLILNFLPCNVSALRTAIENLLTDPEQVLLSGAPREGLALGMLIAALATSGMAGHAAWEHLRGPRERTASLDWPDGGALARHNLAVGLQLSEMP
jgi:hypothetical protein